MAFDTPENLEKHLLSPNEVVLTSDDSAAEIRVLLEGVDHITDLTLEETGTGLVTARIKTDLSNVYDLSRTVFFAFATAGKALLELTVKKANLEDIFLELAETDDRASEPPAVEAEIVESEVTEE